MGHVQALKILHYLVWNDPAEKSKTLLKIKSILKSINLYFLDAKFQLLGICCSQRYPVEATVLWFMTLLDPFWWVWGNNSSKQCQIELKF